MKIKLFVDAHVFDESYQGTTTHIKGLYTSMVNDDDFEITLAANDIENLKTHFPDSRFKFIQLPSPGKVKRLALDLPKIIKANKFDYAHFQYITPIKKACRYVNTIHDLLFLDYRKYFPFKYKFINKTAFRFSARNADIICTVSEFSKEALTRHFGVEPKDIIITPNAIDVYHGDFVNVKEKYKVDKYLLFVSRLEPRKNHYLMLRTFVDLKLYGQGYKMVFIGRTKDVKTSRFLNYYTKLPEKIKNEVLLLENLTLQELNSFYKDAELFVYPSMAEGFGIPPLEAAMLNCKVLCSNQTAMSDFDFFGKYSFNPNDPEELKSKIVSTLIDENYPYSEIRNAILQRYSWHVASAILAKKLREDYKTLRH